MSGGRQRGISLVELIVAIVIVSIATSGVMLVYAVTVGHSADPLVQQQALAIGEAYLDEILARPVADPSGGETGGAEPGESRPDFDDVQDYAGLSDSPPLSQDGTAADLDGDMQPDLAGYSVAVTVDPAVTVAGVTLARVDVRVRRAPVDFTLTGYRYGGS